MHKSLLKLNRFAIRLRCLKALHSHSAKSPKDGDISRWLITAKSLVVLKLLSVVAALMLSTTVSAIGMGGIDVASALGQTLKADIAMMDISKAEKDSLVVRLASPDTYKNSNLEYPYGKKFKFLIQSRANGQTYIQVSSAKPINDPFVSLLVELNWSAGRLTREYTFLLDPPGYVPQQPAPVTVRPVAPAVQVAAPATVVSEVPLVSEQASELKSPAAPVVTVTPAKQKQPVEPVPTTLKPATQAAALEVTELPKNQEWHAVQRGDTLYKLAEKYKHADMNLDRMLVALYRVNVKKFDDKNMNRIQAGKILRLPTQDDYSSVTQAEAVKEIHAQAADWNAYRQKLASAASVSKQSQDMQQVASGKISSSIADMAPVVKGTAKEVLKLSKGEAPGDEIGAGAQSGQDKKNAAQEDAIANSNALKAGQERAALLVKNIQDMKRLAELKVEAAALAQPAIQAPASEVAAAIVVKPTTVVVKPKPQLVKPEPSLIDQVLEEPLYLAGGVAVLLALAGLGFMVNRRKKLSNEFAEELAEKVGEITGRMASPVLPSPDTGDFTVKEAVAKEAVAEVIVTPESDIVDPISEADLFLNFGRDVQAEEILKDALQNSPNNLQIQLKLLGIYANRKDINSFSMYARQLQDSGDEDAWEQAVVMGRKLEPDNPMYGGGFRSMEDTGSATVQVAAFNATDEPEDAAKGKVALDFDFDLGAPSNQSDSTPERDYLNDTENTTKMLADDRIATQDTPMDFDITSDQTITLTDTGKEGELDFDITSTNSSKPAASELLGALEQSPDGQDFDIPGSHSSLTSEAEQLETNKPAVVEDDGMEFTLDFPAEKPVAPVQAASEGLAGINLNFDDVVVPEGSPAENKDENWQDVATKLDLAKAYHEMGDASGAREILEEVMRDGDAQQRESAQAIFDQLG